MNARRGVVGGLGTVLIVLACGGFGPASSCAKGCRKAGSSSGDDLVRHGDDVARYTPTGRGGHVPVVIPGGSLGDDLAHLAPSRLEEAASVLPEVEGAVVDLARKPSTSGRSLRGIDGTERGFARDYARSIDDIGLSAKQHDEVIDALGLAQDVAENLIEYLVEDALEPEKMESPRQRFASEARLLDARLHGLLADDQVEKLYATLGSADVILYRLGQERPIARRAAP